MAIQYILINETKKEQISFLHLNGSTRRELAGNSPQASIVTWYMLENTGDEIQFISDTHDDWPFKTGNKNASRSYTEKTNDVINTLINNSILEDRGYIYRDPEDPDNVFIRDIVNVWNE